MTGESPATRARTLTRRRLLATTGAAALAPVVAAEVRAQGLNGEIRVGYDGTNTKIGPHVQAAASAVQAANPDASISVEPSPGGNYLTQTALQLFGGRAPDVFLIAGLGAGELANAEWVLPLDDYLAGWEGWSFYPEAVRYGVSHNGSIWAVPYALDTSFIYYRTDIFASAGLPATWQPATPDDILAAARQIKGSGLDVIPYALYAGANGETATAGAFLTLIRAFGGTLTDETGRWYIDSCPIRETLDHYAQAYQLDQTVPQEVMTIANPLEAMPDAMGNGELGILYEQSRLYGDWVDDPATQVHEQIGYTHYPYADQSGTFALGGVGDCWYINRDCVAPDLAWAFIQAFNSRETQVALNVEVPRIPARTDAAGDLAFQRTRFLREMIATAGSVYVPPPEPTYRSLVGIVQNATGIVATGEATSETSVDRYASELTRVLGPANVIAEPCP